MNKPAIRMAVFGECMLEFITLASDQIKQSYAGDTLNTAIYFSRLLPLKSKVEYVTAIGDDPLSCAMRNYWTTEGVESTYCLTVQGKNPGLYFILNTDDGERTFQYWRQDSAAKYYFKQQQSHALPKQLESFDAIYLSGISVAILDVEDREKLLNMLSLVRKLGVKVFFDPNYRPALWSSRSEAVKELDKFAQVVDIIFPSMDDELQLRGESTVESVLEHYRKLGVGEIVLKNGKLPGYVASNSNVEKYPLTDSVVAIDTTGAGDAFNAAYITARLAGNNTKRSFEQGNLLAAKVVQFRGAIIPEDNMP